MDFPRLETMGQCLRAWMEEEDLTTAEIAEMAGYRSKTSVARILRDECEEKPLELLREKLQPNWNPAWQRRFRQAMAVTRFGIEQYRLFCVFDQRLFSKQTESPVPESGFATGLEHPARLYVLGCPWEETTAWVEEMKRGHSGMKICHYFREEELLTSPALMDLLLLSIADSDYQAYLISEDVWFNLRMPWNFCILAEDEETEGKIFFYEREQWHGLGLDGAKLKEMIRQLRHCGTTSLYLNDQLENGRDYIEFSQKCYQMERGREMAAIRPTPGLQMFPATVVRASFHDFLAIAQNPIAAAKDTLVYTHEKRINNFFQRSRGTTLLLAEQGMKNFAQSGRLPDQFFAFRTFTQPEREMIFRTLLEFSRRKGVEILVRKGQEDALSMEIYEGKGVIIYPSNGSYNREGKYRELFLTGKRIEKLCWNYMADLKEREFVVPAEGLLRSLLARMAASSGM